ncbi:hypothetical protein Tco_0759586 [Tanacetum coccineum]
MTTSNIFDSLSMEDALTQDVGLKAPMVLSRFGATLVIHSALQQSSQCGKEKSIAFLQSEKEKILSEKKDLADSYLDEIVCLKNANKVARDMLQRFNMPTHTIPMLSKKPKAATADLHKDLLGTRNPGLGYIAKRAQPVLYDADTLLHPAHHPVRIWDSEDVLVHQVVSMKKMSEKPGHVRPANDFYAKLNALMFVPQKELSGDQVYWLSANEIASQASKPATPATPFVHKSRPPSQVLFHFQQVNAVFHQFEDQLQGNVTISEFMKLRSTHEGVGMIQLDGLKVENVSLKRRYDELSKANTHSRTAYTERLSLTDSNCQTENCRTKPATESRKPMPKSHTRNHHILPNKSVNARRAAYHNRKLNVVDHNQFSCSDSFLDTAWRPTRKVVGSVKPQWKPTGRHFALYDTCPLTRIMEPIVEPLELTPSVSSSSKVTMISRFTDCKHSDQKAGSKGLSGIF